MIYDGIPIEERLNQTQNLEKTRIYKSVIINYCIRIYVTDCVLLPYLIVPLRHLELQWTIRGVHKRNRVLQWFVVVLQFVIAQQLKKTIKKLLLLIKS